MFLRFAEELLELLLYDMSKALAIGKESIDFLRVVIARGIKRPTLRDYSL